MEFVKLAPCVKVKKACKRLHYEKKRLTLRSLKKFGIKND
jgi:hypothetical protein